MRIGHNSGQTGAPVDEWQERYRLALQDFAEQDSETERLDELRKIVFSELVNACGDMAVSKAEHIARADQRYRRICEDLWIARRKANLAKAEVKSMEVGFETWRTRSATKRAEMLRLG